MLKGKQSHWAFPGIDELGLEGGDGSLPGAGNEQQHSGNMDLEILRKKHWRREKTEPWGPHGKLRESTLPLRDRRKMPFSASELLYHKECFNFIPQCALKWRPENQPQSS